MTGQELINQERDRQIDKEGYSDNHDNNHDKYQLEAAGDAYYLHTKSGKKSPLPKFWPFEDSSWKPSDDQIKNLTKAGALYSAELDRLKRADKEDPGSIEQMKSNISEVSILIDGILEQQK